MRGEGITGPGIIAKDSILVHGMGLDGIFLTDWRTVIGIVFGSICSKFEFAVRVGLNEPLIAARVIQEEPRLSIYRFGDTSGARGQNCCCSISPEPKLVRESQFECYAIDRHWVVGEWTFKAGQPVTVDSSMKAY